MKRYRYAGPISNVQLKTGESLALFPGGELSLPEDDERVSVLVERGHLTEVAPEVLPGTVQGRGGRTQSRTIQPNESGASPSGASESSPE